MVYVVQIVSMLMIHNMNTPLLKLGRLVESLVMFHIFEIVKEIRFVTGLWAFQKLRLSMQFILGAHYATFHCEIVGDEGRQLKFVRCVGVCDFPTTETGGNSGRANSGVFCDLVADHNSYNVRLSVRIWQRPISRLANQRHYNSQADIIMAAPVDTDGHVVVKRSVHDKIIDNGIRMLWKWSAQLKKLSHANNARIPFFHKFCTKSCIKCARLQSVLSWLML